MARLRVLIACLFFLPSMVSAENLRLGIGTSPGSSYPPYLVVAEDRSYSGLEIDILAAVLKLTGDQVLPVYMPAPRLFAGISEGTVDVDLFSNPAWRPEYNKDSLYTVPYLKTRMILVMRKDLTDPPQSMKDLVGRTVLTVNGFHYPGLDEMFDRQDVTRDVAPSTALLLKMLQANRRSLGVSDEAVFIDLARREGYDALVAGFAVSPPTEVRMRFPRRLASVVDRFNVAINQLTVSGELAKIRAKYGLKP